MIEVVDKAKCCGCTACVNVCPKKCISMCTDEEGFRYPLVDMEKCISCGICERVCPCSHFKKPEQECKTRAFVLRTMNESVLAESTSGGAFSAIAGLINDENGVVVGAAFDENFKIVHKIVSNCGDISVFYGSKYAQSKLGDTFSAIKRFLQQDKLVCFSGTPCQVAGLKNYLGIDYHNLYTVDIVCRSVPSPKLWNEYIDQFSASGGGIKQVKFRNKTYGYHSGTLIIKFKNGRIISESNRVNKYMKAFHMNICSRPSCYECKFKTVERVSDFTLFDCWHPEKLIADFKDDDRGYSGCLVHSNKGLELIRKIKPRISIYEVDVAKALEFTGGMAEHSINKPLERSEFYTTLTENGIDATLDRYVKVSVFDRLVENSKGILYKANILQKIKSIK